MGIKKKKDKNARLTQYPVNKFQTKKSQTGGRNGWENCHIGNGHRSLFVSKYGEFLQINKGLKKHSNPKEI